MDSFAGLEDAFFGAGWRQLPSTEPGNSGLGFLFKLLVASDLPDGHGLGAAMLLTDYERMYFEGIKDRQIARRLRAVEGTQTQSQLDAQSWTDDWNAPDGTQAAMVKQAQWDSLDVALVPKSGVGLHFQLEPLPAAQSASLLRQHLLAPALGALSSLVASQNGKIDADSVEDAVDRSALDADLKPLKLGTLFEATIAGSIVSRWTQAVAGLPDLVEIGEPTLAPARPSAAATLSKGKGKASSPQSGLDAPEPAPMEIEKAPSPIEPSPPPRISPRKSKSGDDDEASATESEGEADGAGTTAASPIAPARQSPFRPASSPPKPPDGPASPIKSALPDQDAPSATPTPAARLPVPSSAPPKPKNDKELEKQRRQDALKTFKAAPAASKPKRKRF